MEMSKKVKFKYFYALTLLNEIGVEMSDEKKKNYRHTTIEVTKTTLQIFNIFTCTGYS